MTPDTHIGAAQIHRMQLDSDNREISARKHFTCYNY